ncbi:hypothetical protein E2C01_079129 [Portunus trituberculatus]|uniref:Uncharacterized protein n=1 Tax=Portunus trituberculatus TaxID=210409 RepID=A0A5B7IG64_PORTR|nr:hypothetical protein [Portunus trituberculatus]
MERGGDGSNGSDSEGSRGSFPRASPRTIAPLRPDCSRPFHNIKEGTLTSPGPRNKCPTLAEWKCLRHDPWSTVN